MGSDGVKYTAYTVLYLPLFLSVLNLEIAPWGKLYYGFNIGTIQSTMARIVTSNSDGDRPVIPQRSPWQHLLDTVNTQEGNGGTLGFQPLHTSLSLKEGRSLFVSLPLSLVRLTHPLWFTPANWQK